MDRRNFFRTSAAIVAGAAGAKAGSAVAAESASGIEHFTGNPDRFGVLVDTTLCIGLNCRACEFACAKENGLPAPDKPPDDPTVFDQVRRPGARAFTVVNRFPNPDPAERPVYAKRQCMHCDEPACASACLVAAFRKTPEGAVIYNPDVCIGCRYCMVACPFNVPGYEYDEPYHPRVRKCELCFKSKTSKGEAPACVLACPKQVMTFGKRSDLLRLANEKIAADGNPYVNHVYGEREVGGTGWLYLASVPFEKIGFRTDLGVKPYPELTLGFLSAVPLVLTMWPVLFTGIYMFSRRREKTISAAETKPETTGGES